MSKYWFWKTAISFSWTLKLESLSPFDGCTDTVYLTDCVMCVFSVLFLLLYLDPSRKRDPDLNETTWLNKGYMLWMAVLRGPASLVSDSNRNVSLSVCGDQLVCHTGKTHRLPYCWRPGLHQPHHQMADRPAELLWRLLLYTGTFKTADCGALSQTYSTGIDL